MKMKGSTLQLLSVVCLLAVGCLTMSLFISEDTAATDYTTNIVLHITRVQCENGVVHHYISREMRDIVPHTNTDPHQHGPPGLRVYFNNTESCSISGCSNCS